MRDLQWLRPAAHVASWIAHILACGALGLLAVCEVSIATWLMAISAVVGGSALLMGTEANVDCSCGDEHANNVAPPSAPGKVRP